MKAENGKLNTVTGSMVTTTKPLVSPRELEIWRLLALGWKCREIANIPGAKKSIKTVDRQRNMLLKKLNVRGNADLTRLAVQYGVITVEVMAPTPVVIQGN